MTNKQIKRSSTLVIIRGMQVKIAITPHTYQDDYYYERVSIELKKTIHTILENAILRTNITL